MYLFILALKATTAYKLVLLEESFDNKDKLDYNNGDLEDYIHNESDGSGMIDLRFDEEEPDGDEFDTYQFNEKENDEDCFEKAIFWDDVMYCFYDYIDGNPLW